MTAAQEESAAGGKLQDGWEVTASVLEKLHLLREGLGAGVQSVLATVVSGAARILFRAEPAQGTEQSCTRVTLTDIFSLPLGLTVISLIPEGSGRPTG